MLQIFVFVSVCSILLARAIVGMIVYFLLTGKTALSIQDGASHTAVISGKAYDRARQLGTPMGTGIAAWLQLDPSARPATCPAAWSTIYREVYGGKSSKNVTGVN